MRLSFADEALRSLYRDAGYRIGNLDPEAVKAYRKKVALLEQVGSEIELRAWRSLNLEKLQGDRQGQWSIRLTRKWRLILRFEADDDGRTVVIIEIVDYH